MIDRVTAIDRFVDHVAGHPDDLRPAVVALVSAIKTKADASWDAASLADVTGADTVAAYQRGRAHAFCESLGDQEHLFRSLDGWEYRDVGE